MSVAWNAPFYAGLRLEILKDTALTLELRKKREAETAHGLTWDPTVPCA